MAVCASCNRLTAPGVSCTLQHWTLPTGHQIPRVRRDVPGDCPDCGCPQGGYHHPGCVVEIIPQGVELEANAC